MRKREALWLALGLGPGGLRAGAHSAGAANEHPQRSRAETGKSHAARLPLERPDSGAGSIDVHPTGRRGLESPCVRSSGLALLPNEFQNISILVASWMRDLCLLNKCLNDYKGDGGPPWGLLIVL